MSNLGISWNVGDRYRPSASRGSIPIIGCLFLSHCRSSGFDWIVDLECRLKHEEVIELSEPFVTLEQSAQVEFRLQCFVFLRLNEYFEFVELNDEFCLVCHALFHLLSQLLHLVVLEALADVHSCGILTRIFVVESYSVEGRNITDTSLHNVVYECHLHHLCLFYLRVAEDDRQSAVCREESTTDSVFATLILTQPFGGSRLSGPPSAIARSSWMALMRSDMILTSNSLYHRTLTT